jgi:ubiquinone biosynthesis protein COQ4
MEATESTMATTDTAANAAPSPERKIEWRRAWTALKGLIADPQRTDLVFEITDSLAGTSFERCYERFCAHPEGRRLLADRPSLLDTLSDRQALAALPEGSLGRRYLEFMQAGELSAEGLVQAEMTAQQRMSSRPVDADRGFYGDRIRDMHDLWHVLTGYGMDEAGEAANLAFTQAQIPNPGIGLIVLAAAVMGPKDLKLTWQRYLYRAWQRGRHATLLTAVPYERLLAMPLEEVRAKLGIEPPSVAHPEGIVVANRVDGEAISVEALNSPEHRHAAA